MRAAELTAQMVAFRQSLGLARKTPGKVPRQAHPTPLMAAYFSAIVEDLRTLEAMFAADVVPFIAGWVLETEREKVRPDGALRVVDVQTAVRRDDGTFETVVKRVVMCDAAGPKIRMKLEQVLKGFNDRTSPARAEAKATKAAKAISDHNKAQLSRQIRSALGVDLAAIGKAEPWLPARMENFVANNVGLIRDLSDDVYRKIALYLPNAIASGMRHEDIGVEIQKRFKLGEKRSARVARDQVLKFQGALNAERQQALGIREFDWSAIMDDRTRDEHADLNGKRFRYDNPPAVEGLPGSRPNCRCQGLPVMTEVMDILRGLQGSAGRKGGGRVRAQAGRAK